MVLPKAVISNFGFSARLEPSCGLCGMYAWWGKSSSVQGKGNSLRNASGQTETCLTKLGFLVRITTVLCSHYTFSQRTWQKLSWAVLSQWNMIGGCKTWTWLVCDRCLFIDVHTRLQVSFFLQGWGLASHYSTIYFGVAWYGITLQYFLHKPKKDKWIGDYADTCESVLWIFFMRLWRKK